ncbi:MAG: gene transfer agent family protein [Cereibacter changlensis]
MKTGRLQWSGGEHEFALPLGKLRALQDACDAGPEEIFNRLRTGRWKVCDIIEPIRLGLIGGGLTDGEAQKLVMPLLNLHPLMEFKLTAITILAAVLLGVKDDPVGEGQGDRSDPPKNGASASSTAAEQ